MTKDEPPQTKLQLDSKSEKLENSLSSNIEVNVDDLPAIALDPDVIRAIEEQTYVKSGRISYAQLYSYAKPFDWLLMSVGITFAVISGATMVSRKKKQSLAIYKFIMNEYILNNEALIAS